MTDPRPPISDARLTANRANALKSTGPRTPEGKARSRRNALTHGLCAQVIEVPDEDPTLIADRFDAWKGELNPGGTDAGDYLVLLAARKSIRLDRCHLVHEAHVAQLARRAKQALRDGRMLEVESLLKLLATEPDFAVRRLKLTPEGCDALLREWRMLEEPLIAPPHWDKADTTRICRLLGLASSCRSECPNPFALSAIHIHEHREVAHKLWLNETPDKLFWNQKYDDPKVHQRDKDRLPWLLDRAELGVELIRASMEQEVAWLHARKAELIEAETTEVAEATYRARFDVSETGKLLRRYEAEAERGLFRAMKEARELNKAERKPAETESRQAESSGRPARNGPNRPSPDLRFDDLLGVASMPFTAGRGPSDPPGGPRHKR